MPPSSPGAAPPALDGFQADLARAVQGLRGALTELLATVPGLPDRPYPMARFLGMDKNLAWKVTQVVRSAEPAEVVRHVPGEAGIARLLDAFERHGAPAPAREAVRAARAEFERVTALHAGDRASLEQLLGSLAPSRRDATQAEASRRLAFQGTSAILGVRVRTHHVLQAVAPGAGGDAELDVVAVGGLLGFQRLRPDVAWPLVRMRVFDEGDSPGMRSLAEGDGPPILAPFCSEPDTPLERRDEEGGVAWSVPSGPVGQTAESDWAFGLHAPAIGSAWSDDPDGVVEIQFRMSTPAEVGVCDLLVHRDLPFEGPPRAQLVSLTCETPRFPMSQHARHVLPATEALEELGAPPVLASPHTPRCRALAELAFERAGWDLAEFRAVRWTFRYPPVPSAALLVYPQRRPLA